MKIRVQVMGTLLLLVLGTNAALWACRIVPEPWPRPRPMPAPLQGIETKSHKVDIEIRDNTAQVTLEAVFYNPNRFQIEGTYIFPVEKNAVFRNFSMWVNGKELKADLLSADKARQIYEDIVRRRRDPALLEYLGQGLLRCRIFPINAQSDVRVKLRYTQVLRTDAGLTSFTYPLRSAKPDAGKIGTLSAKVTVKTSRELRTVYCPTHKTDIKRPDGKTAVLGLEQSNVMPDRDLQVYFMQSGQDIDVGLLTHSEPGEDGYFMLTVSPTRDIKADTKVAKNILFVIDTSGSMSGKKIAQARNALKFCLKNLNPIDTFNVITFSTTTNMMFRQMIPATTENVDIALKRTDKIEAGGGTAIDEALTESLKMIGDKKGLKMIVFLTDGLPTIGETDVSRIMKNVRQNDKSGTRVFAFGVGFDVNTDLIDGIAKETNGTQEYVTENEDLEVKVSSFYSKIANPILSDVKIDVRGVDIYDYYPNRIPDLFKGSELTLLGRLRGPGAATVVLTGKVNDQGKEFTYKVDFPKRADNDFLPSLWAFRKVAYLMESIRLNGPKQELKDEVIKLGKRYGIMTPYTSFLVLEEDEARRHAHVMRARTEAFEKAKEGRAGVMNSKQLAEAQDAAAAPTSPGRANMMGFAGGKDDRGVEQLKKQAEERIKTVRDKTFILRNGIWVDTVYDPKKQGEPQKIQYFSKEFFALVQQHPDMNKYLLDDVKMVICIGEKSYLLEP